MARSVTRTHVTYSTIEKVFPRDSACAPYVASLISIRSDMLVEQRMLTQDDPIKGMGARGLDEEFHARVYFFKGNLRSLYSVERVIPNLVQTAEFKAMIAPVQARFDELRNALTTASKEFVGLRNTIGAHTEKLEEVRAALEDEQMIALEFNNAFGLASQRISNIFNIVALFGHAETNDEAMEMARERMRRLGAATAACWRLIDLVVSTYLSSRGH
jgi:hypothetical protein